MNKINKKQKLDGFTLIELLVTIVIIGILSGVTVASFSSYFGKARDAVRVSNVQLMSTTIATNSADKWKASEKYAFVNDGTNTGVKLSSIFALDGFKAPKGENGVCYHFGFYTKSGNGSSKDNGYYVATWGESTSTDKPGTAGPIYAGTKNATDVLKAETLTSASFECTAAHVPIAIDGLDNANKLFINASGAIK
jgi:prepilin-type N-terminal cleavage/methylation domain-containing protein